MACERVHEVFEVHRKAIRHGTDLPERVGYAMWSLRSVLDEAAKTQCDELRNRVFETAALESCVKMGYNGGVLSWKPSKELDRRNQKHRVLASVLGVTAAMEDNSACGARLWVEAFIEAISQFEYEKAVDDSLSSVALLDGLRLARTWSQLGPFRAPPKESLPKQDPSRDNDDPEVHGACKVTTGPADEPHRENLGQLLRTFCEAPWPKDHRSPAWLEKVVESRKRLANIWQTIRDKYNRDEPNWRAEMSYLSHDLSLEYIEEVHEERELGENQIRCLKTLHSKQQNVPQVLQTTWGTADNGNIPIKVRVEKVKIKTTGRLTAEHLSVADLGAHESDSVGLDSGQTVNNPLLVLTTSSKTASAYSERCSGRTKSRRSAQSSGRSSSKHSPMPVSSQHKP
jgi:hypothetical protein